MAMKFVEVVFATSAKRYTYHTDLDVGPNDKALVLTADGLTPVTVCRVLDYAPAFKTKPLHSKHYG